VVFPLVVALELFAACAPLPFGSAPQAAVSRTVLATVSDARNRPIVDVGADDFVVKEDGEAREVFDVHIGDYPIVLLIDNGAAARSDFESIRKAGSRFIERVGQRPLVLGTFGAAPALLTTFDDDRKAVTSKLAAVTVTSSTESLPLQAVADASRMVHQAGALFSAIVVVSATPADPTRQPPGDLLGSVLDSGAIVHVVANRSALSRPEGMAARNADLIRALSDQTHGVFTTIYSASSYQSALDRLADRLSAEMMIQYLVPKGAAAATDVKVGVRVPGLRVHGLGVK
jgi:hypothetical protein